MNSLLDKDTEDDLDDRPVRARDREITLGTTMVLGIFFALAAYGAVLFGFGYSMGVKHLTATAPVAAADGGTSFSGFKPAPGSPLGTNTGTTSAAMKPVGGSSVKGSSVNGSSVSGSSVTVPDAPAEASASARPVPQPRAQTEATSPDAASQRPAAPIVRAPVAATASLATVPYAGAAPGAAGAFLVQVAAVSHQEDADLLVVTLKRRGYPVAIHHEAQDTLLHVQIGNFINKKDADTMRQRLLADGFNAIVK